jgi:transcriptional regulator with XRE-family HTH domain
MSFGERLRLARMKIGMTQEQLANEFGLTQAAVGKWEISGGFPDTLKLVPITKILGVTLDWLLEADNSSLPEQFEKRKKITPMALINKISGALDSNHLTEAQISLLSDMASEFVRLNTQLANETTK